MPRSLDVLSFGGDTDTGLVREHNEDRLLLLPDIGVFGVVDGMGGESAGEKAAEIAVAVLKANFLRVKAAADSADLIRQVQLAILDANNQIHDMAIANAEWAGMACVLTVAVVRGDRVVIGHVGDSRLYKLTRDTIEKLTKDHSPVGMREDARELTELQAMRDSRRHEVFRDVGSQLRPENDYEFADVFETRLEPDSAILLCSDGLTDMITSSEIHKVVVHNAGDPVQASRDLVRVANEAGGHDNISAIVVEGSRFKESVRAPESVRPGEDGGFSLGQLLRPLVSRPAIFLYGALAGIGLFFYFQVTSVGPTTGNPGQTIRVSPVGGRFPTISEALAVAREGDRIEVEPGDYRESVVLTNGVTLVSTIPHAATIRPPRVPGVGAAGFVAQAVRTNINGFKIVAGEDGLDVGLRLKDANVVAANLDIGPAVVAGILIEGNTSGLVRGNSAGSGPGTALTIQGANDVLVEMNWFAAGSDSMPTVEVTEGSSAQIIRNLIEGRTAASVRAPASLLSQIMRNNRLFLESPQR